MHNDECDLVAKRFGHKSYVVDRYACTCSSAAASAVELYGSPHLSGEQSLEVGWTADAETRAAEEGDALTYVDFTFP